MTLLALSLTVVAVARMERPSPARGSVSIGKLSSPRELIWVPEPGPALPERTFNDVLRDLGTYDP